MDCQYRVTHQVNNLMCHPVLLIEIICTSSIHVRLYYIQYVGQTYKLKFLKKPQIRITAAICWPCCPDAEIILKFPPRADVVPSELRTRICCCCGGCVCGIAAEPPSILTIRICCCCCCCSGCCSCCWTTSPPPPITLYCGCCDTFKRNEIQTKLLEETQYWSNERAFQRSFGRSFQQKYFLHLYVLSVFLQKKLPFCRRAFFQQKPTLLTAFLSLTWPIFRPNIFMLFCRNYISAETASFTRNGLFQFCRNNLLVALPKEKNPLSVDH